MTLEEAFELGVGRLPANNEEMDAFVKAFNASADSLGLPRITYDNVLGWDIPTEIPENVAKRFATLFYDQFNASIALPKLKQADAERAYFDALRAAKLWPPKSEEYLKELVKRFSDIWDAFGRGDLGDIPDAAAFTQLIGENLPEPEAEFLSLYKEKQRINQDFDAAFQELISKKAIEIPPELQDVVKAILGKQYVDAKYSQPATTQAQQVIQMGLKGAIAQAQTGREAGIREDALAQFIAEGDYDRAARLIGPPPSPVERLTQLEALESGQQPAEALEELPPSTPEQREAASYEGAALRSVPTFGTATGGIISADVPYRQAVEGVIGKQDPGFQKFLQAEYQTGLNDVGLRRLQQGFQERGPRDRRFEDFSTFVGQEFEKLRPAYEEEFVAPEQAKQKRQELVQEQSRARAFRSSLLTRYR